MRASETRLGALRRGRRCLCRISGGRRAIGSEMESISATIGREMGAKSATIGREMEAMSAFLLASCPA